MEFIAQSRSVRMSPRKVRLVADLVRNIPVAKALTLLSLLPKRAALPIEKTIKSAYANALQVKPGSDPSKVSRDALYVKRIEIGEGQAMKRFHPSTRGRAHPYKKRSSHILVVLEEKK